MPDTHNRIAFFLPNIFTALNMACGFVAIMFSLRGNAYYACLLLLLGALFDSVDGRIARMTGTTSAFGEQFDSMSDLVSFGVAPALVYYNFFLIPFGRIGMALAFIYVLCGALRLARFNANIDKVSSDYFQGIPIPGAALTLIGIILFFNHLGLEKPFTYITLPYIFIYSILMISSMPFPSFKNSDWVRAHKKQSLILIFLILMLAFTYEEYTILVVMNLFALGSCIHFLRNKEKFRGIFHWKND